MIREARCSCGALTVLCEGDPRGGGACSCLDCQKRTGSAFGWAAVYDEDKVEIRGASTVWRRPADRGGDVEQHFCPTCGSTVWWRRPSPGVIVVAGGCFGDKDFPAPRRAVFAERRHTWVCFNGVQDA